MTMNWEKEVWKDITGFEGIYQISNMGRVKSLRRWRNGRNGGRIVSERILKPLSAFNGYQGVQLRNHYRKTCCFVHRLVAQHFVDNPDGKPIVNHLDMDKCNNNAENLEWTDKSGNALHAIQNGRWNMKNRTV